VSIHVNQSMVAYEHRGTICCLTFAGGIEGSPNSFEKGERGDCRVRIWEGGKDSSTSSQSISVIARASQT
jgi:hypothetical protein